MALSWVTAGSYSQDNVILDRFSLPTMDVGPLTLAQTDLEHGKEPDYPMGGDMGQVASLPPSFYDYIPRDQRSQSGNSRSSIKKVRSYLYVPEHSVTRENHILARLVPTIERKIQIIKRTDRGSRASEFQCLIHHTIGLNRCLLLRRSERLPM